MHQLRVARPIHGHKGNTPREQEQMIWIPLPQATEKHPHYLQSPQSEKVELCPFPMPCQVLSGTPTSSY